MADQGVDNAHVSFETRLRAVPQDERGWGVFWNKFCKLLQFALVLRKPKGCLEGYVRTFRKMIFTLLLSLTASPAPLSVAVLDMTGCDTQATCGPLLALMESVEMVPEIYDLKDLVDDPDLATSIPAEHEAAFFIFSTEFFGGMTTSPLARKILGILQACAAKKDFLTALFMPCFNSIKDSRGNVVRLFSPVFDRLGLRTPQGDLALTDQAGMEALARGDQATCFFYALNRMLSRPLIARPQLYDTTLCTPHQGIRFENEVTTALQKNTAINLSFLPTRIDFPRMVGPQLPFFLYWRNEKRRNHLVVSYATLATFSGLVESFHVRPQNNATLELLHEMIQRGLWQIKSCMKSSKADAGWNKVMPLSLPASLDFGRPVYSGDRTRPLRKIAWMEIILYQDKEYPVNMSAAKVAVDKADRRQRQNDLISYILLGGLDALWISYNPQQFYSPIAKDKNKEQLFLSGVARFNRKLVAASQKLKKPLPAILVGFEIANNLYKPNLPKDPAVDIFASVYDDIPAPLDQSFWDNEVVTPLKKFAQQWQRPGIGNGVPLAGVVIDLEMYCRRRTGTYTASMGFDRPTLERFVREGGWRDADDEDDDAVRPLPETVDGVVSLFMEQQCYGKFVDFLFDHAQALGEHVRSAVRRVIPKGQLVCYAPSMLIDWFYKGLFAGMSEPGDPLCLLTFNVEFGSHRSWLEQQGIYAFHRSVILLSKIARPGDAEKLAQIMTHHGGYWLNRFSRMVEDYHPTCWTGVERLPKAMSGVREKLQLMQEIAVQ